MSLQVHEKFRLLAFCTHRLHFFQILYAERFGRVRHSHHIPGSLLLLALISPLFVLSSTACVKLPHKTPAPLSQFAPLPLIEAGAARPVDINTASAQELERLPGIGPGLAARIISHRAQYGRFRRAEHLMMVRGIGERRFRRLRSYIKV